MDTRSDRGQFYPGGATSSVPAGGSTDKVDRVALGEIGESYTLKTVKQKVNQIVRAIAPVAVGCLVLSAWCLVLGAGASTGVLEDLSNTAQVVTNEEDAVAMAALTAATNALELTGKAAFQAASDRLDSATNVLAVQMAELRSAESNRVEATYAKRSEIPAAQDLAQYALKSELPTDYLRENDITNFASRSWISAQGYATGAEMGARLDAQDNAIAAATNAQNAAIAATSNALATAHAADVAALGVAMVTASNALANAMSAQELRGMAAVQAQSNRLDAATNAIVAAHAADMATLGTATNDLAEAVAELRDETNDRIDGLELAIADTNATLRLVTADGAMWQDATGVVWQVGRQYGAWAADTNIVTGFSWNPETPGDEVNWIIAFDVTNRPAFLYCQAPGTKTNEVVEGWTYADTMEDGDFAFTISRPVNLIMEAVDRVAYTNDLTAATNAAYEAAVAEAQERITTLEEMGTVYGAWRLVPVEAEGEVTASNVWQIARAATNYTDEATNALAQAIGGGGGGGGAPEWRVVTQECGSISFVTNGMSVVRFAEYDPLQLANGERPENSGWQDGAAMFSRWLIASEGVEHYWPADYMRLVGYGTWPTNDCQCVWWRSGTNIFVNVLVEE